MTDALTRLDEIEARANWSTRGPWHHSRRDFEDWSVVEGDPDLDDGYVVAQHALEEDAEFIAHNREDVPALVAALRAVLAMHKPTEADVVSDPACCAEECDHQGECPATGSVTICAACDDMCESAYEYYAEEHLRVTAWPCPTVTAITNALGGTR